MEQKTFEKLMQLSRELKRKSLERGDSDGWGDGDQLYWLLLKAANEDVDSRPDGEGSK